LISNAVKDEKASDNSLSIAPTNITQGVKEEEPAPKHSQVPKLAIEQQFPSRRLRN